MSTHVSSIVLRNATVALQDGLTRCDIGMQDGKIAEIGTTQLPYDTEIDALDFMAMPGMIDVHIHGAMHVDVNSASREDLNTLSLFLAQEGVTGFVPSLVCDAEKTLLEQIQTVAEARGHLDGAQILGCHVEGPFLSPDYRGVMQRRYLQAGDAAMVSRFLGAAKSCKLAMTAAPDAEGVEALMHYIVSQGIRVGLGHSGATYEQAMHCLRLGATSFVHVMNAMRPLDRHEPGILGAALESDAFVEFICDGLHLHPANVRLLLKTKGIDQLVAISDSMMAAGLGDGIFRLGKQKIVVKDGDARLRGKTRAGSTLTLRKALINFLHYTDLQPDQAILPMTSNPARLLGLHKTKGRIAPGMDADLVVFDPHMNVQYTFVGQRLVYQRQ